jgi:hypothetical protein
MHRLYKNFSMKKEGYLRDNNSDFLAKVTRESSGKLHWGHLTALVSSSKYFEHYMHAKLVKVLPKINGVS